MSKFLELCKKVETVLKEQDEQQMQQDAPQAPVEQPAPPAPTEPQQQPEDTQSELPIVSNDKIAKLVNAMKIFYSKEDSKLESDDVKQILSLNPRNSEESEDIVGIIDTLTNIFNPVSIKTEPDDVKPSTTE